LKKILHTESSCGWGGQEIRILEESRSLTRLGYDITIASPRHSNIFHQSLRYGVKRLEAAIDKKSIKAALKVRSLIKSLSPEVIITHSSTDSWLVGLALITLSKRPKIIRVRHISSPIPNNFASKWLYKKSADLIVTTGTSILNQIHTQFGVPLARMHSIPTGIDQNRFYPNPDRTIFKNHNIDKNGFYIGIIATIRSWKGHIYLITSLTELSEHIKLIVVGDGPAKAAAQNITKELNLTDRVFFVGNTDIPERWLNTFDIFCLPSYANEGVPQALIQAMLTKLPIVTTNIGSITDAVDEESALFVETKNHLAIANAITQLYNSSALREKISESAHRKALSEFTLEAMIKKMIDVIGD